MDFFASPFYMAAGGALASAPILIHLINRMRYKRIRWAAMEFLLKSQKRNRRKLIIEQLILLLLRILLVLLAAFLVAQFLYAGAGARGASHVLVIDDTLSMNDRGKAGSRDGQAFEVGVKQVRKIFEQAVKAPSTQQMSVFLLSDIGEWQKNAQIVLDKDNPESERKIALPPAFWEGKLTNKSSQEIEDKFLARGMKATLRHGRPLDAFRAAAGLLSQVKGEAAQGTKFIHFVSDFRDSDWTGGPDAEKISDEIKGMVKDGINVNLLDAGLPYRSASSKVALFSDNIAIVDLKAATRVAIEEADVQFTASVANFGQAEVTGRQLKVFVNGNAAFEADQVIPKIAAGATELVNFKLRFPKRAVKGGDINEKDSPADRERKRRLDREYFQVRVTLPREDVGLNVDNVRDMAIEVRKKIPTLVVDGNKPENRGEAGDLHHLKAFYSASGVYDLEERRLLDLEAADLDLYPSIVLLNVSDIPPAVVARLKQYVENGGSLCYFMGEEIKPEHYNVELFKAGIFPVQIVDRPHDPLAAAFGDPDLRQAERERLRQIDPTPKILFPRGDHPLVSRISPFRSLFRFMSINVYWKALPRSQWDPEPRRAETLVVLPNAANIDQYRGRAIDLAAKAVGRVTVLRDKEKDFFEKYVGPLGNYQIRIRDACARGELYKLSEELDGMLKDAGAKLADGKEDPEKPSMPALWQHAELKALKAEIEEFREEVLYGDPLVVSKSVGKGRVVAMLTPAGTMTRRGVGAEDSVQWNNWGAGEKLVSQTYPLFMLDMQRYLVSEGQAPNRVLGEEVNFTVDAKRYEPGYTWTFTPQPDVAVEGGKPEVEKEKGVMTKEGERLQFKLKDQGRPGVYEVSLTHLVGDGAAEDRVEKRSYAYNVDAASESNLKRASRDRLLPDTLVPTDGPQTTGGKLRLILPEDSVEHLEQKFPTASEWPWLYLFIMLILIVEQALAVHLSHHTRGDTSQTEGQGASPAAPPAAA